MFDHHGYPSTAELNREAAAEARDVADLNTLTALRQAVADAFAVASRADEIRHPDRKWMVADLTDALHAELGAIDETIAMIARGGVVIEDEG